MNMITIDAHSRDIVANMDKEGTPDANSFLWMCQLRSYWDSSISDCRIKICDATFGYGYGECVFACLLRVARTVQQHPCICGGVFPQDFATSH